MDAFKNKKALGLMSKDEIAHYLLQAIAKKNICIQHNESELIGVITFDPKWMGNKFLIDQVWTNSKTAMRCFVRKLRIEFPMVTELFGFRRNRLVTFKLSTLIKIYGN